LRDLLPGCKLDSSNSSSAMLPSHTHRPGRGGKLAQFRPQLIVLSLFVVALFILWPSVPKYPSQPAAVKPPAAAGDSSKQQAPAAAKVPVELFVMSMCPGEITGCSVFPSTVTMLTLHH
jgi:hypothetical protein